MYYDYSTDVRASDLSLAVSFCIVASYCTYSTSTSTVELERLSKTSVKQSYLSLIHTYYVAMTTTSTVRDDILARRMFFLGLAFLPWLWVVNVLYFWDDVYGPYCPCFNSSTTSTAGGEGAQDEGEEPSSSTALTGGMSSSSSSHSRGQEQRNDEEIAAEVSKWVRRSTLGSIIMFLALVAWMTVIQTNRDSFGPKWFVIPLTDAERTGW